MTSIDSISVEGWHDLFNSIIEDADSNILLLDEGLNVLTLNPGFYWFFLESYSVELKRGSSFTEALKKVNLQLSLEWEKRCLAALNGNALKVEETFEIDGQSFYWEIHVKSTRGPAVTPVISIFSRDITVRKAFQKKIIENEANVRSILNTIDDSIWLVNSNFELIDFNKEFYKKYKTIFDVRLIRGENILDLIPSRFPELKEVWRQRYSSGLKGKPGKFLDDFLFEKELRTFEVRTFPILDNGVVRGLTVYGRDITTQVRAENLLKKQNEELSIINSELDRFVYSASHDLRAPLMSVKGLLNMIKLDPDPKNKEHYLSLIDRSVNKLDNFISDIINYSRNSRMDLVVKEIDFHDLLKESIESLKFMDGADKVRSVRKIEIDHPFFSDHGRLQIIFNNIISNAVRYRAHWRDDSYISISISANEEKAIIIFSDNGVGIAKEYIDNIFKMFFRANADSKGSGIGLYIVKGAVERIHGRITVESEYGQGTSFSIEIPNLRKTN
jgi:PAS domain S-box-containing protein